MSPERPVHRDKGFIEKIKRMINVSADMELKLINSFNIKGESGDDNTHYSGLVCISYSNPNLDLKKIEIFPGENEAGKPEGYTEQELKDMTLKLKLPEDAEVFRQPTGGQPRDSAAKFTSSILGMPYGVIVFGEDIHTEEPVVTMFTIAGQIPREILKDMRDAILKNKISAN